MKNLFVIHLSISNENVLFSGFHENETNGLDGEGKKMTQEKDDVKEEERSSEEKRKGKNRGIVSMVSNGKIALNLAVTMTALMNLGFNEATLEQHLRDVSYMFKRREREREKTERKREQFS